MTRINYKVIMTLVGIQLCLSLLFLNEEAKAQSINNPLPIKVGVTRVVTLNQNERNFFQTPLPVGTFRIILDIRRDSKGGTNLQGGLSILDQNGAPLKENAIRFNEIDVDYRKVHSFSLKTPKTIGLKLSSDQNGTRFWLTVLRASDPAPLPFFNDVMPVPMLESHAKSGVLDAGKSDYYLINLKKGDYKAVLDLTNSEGKKTNIQGYLALLDAHGGNQEVIIRMNQIDVSYRQVGTFSLKNDATLMVRVKNNIYRVNYTVNVMPTFPK